MNVGTLEDACSSGVSQRMFGSGQEWWWGGHQGSVVALYLKWCRSSISVLFKSFMNEPTKYFIVVYQWTFDVYCEYNISAWSAIRFTIRFRINQGYPVMEMCSQLLWIMDVYN